MWAEELTAGRGWIALALVVFAAWRPWRLLARRLPLRRGDDLRAAGQGRRHQPRRRRSSSRRCPILPRSSSSRLSRRGGRSAPRRRPASGIRSSRPPKPTGRHQNDAILPDARFSGPAAAAATLPLLGSRAFAAGRRSRSPSSTSGRSATSARPTPTTRAARRPRRSSATRSTTTYVENVAEGPDSERVIKQPRRRRQPADLHHARSAS